MDIDERLAEWRERNTWLSNTDAGTAKFYEDKERERLTRFKAFLNFLDEQASRIRYVGKDWSISPPDTI